MTTTPDYAAIAAALAALAREHGLPNGIGPTELAFLMGHAGDTAFKLMLGRVFTSERIGLNRELAPHGIKVASYGRSDDGGMVANLDLAVRG